MDNVLRACQIHFCLSPDDWSLDKHYTERPVAKEAQLDRFQDHGQTLGVSKS